VFVLYPVKSTVLSPWGLMTTDCERPFDLRSSLRWLLNVGFISCLPVYELDLAVSDAVLFSSVPPPIDGFFAGRVPGVVAGAAFAAPGIVNLDEPPKLPFGVGSFF
jgi:hypothetical protein